MKITRFPQVAMLVGVVALTGTTLAACSTGDDTSSGGKTTISFLTGSDTTNTTTAKDLIAAFEEANPTIKVKLETQPGGQSADNLVKTKLSTGEMEDVFYYNSGSLLQALNPDTSLVDLGAQSWAGKLSDSFKSSVSTSKGLYGAPMGTTLAGGVMYNRDVYKKLGLSVPTTWAQFLANSEKIKADDPSVAPVLQTYGDTWTAQMMILADYANVQAQDPDWASKYTANKVKYVNRPALTSWQHLADLHNGGLLNKDFASMTNVNGLKAVADGSAAQYPMLSSLVATIVQNEPAEVDNVGFFALPADDASDTTLTMWEPSALYIPKTTTGGKLDAAKKFIAFVNGSAGCAIQNKDLSASGPYAISTCTLPTDAPSLLADIEKYTGSGRTAVALEFQSPVKGPNLESIAIQVGSGITSAAKGASLYDQDVKKQAQQLGLKGW
ncbi:extracellular solute-binding protein [Streptomyces sp. S3(2020)]|uniref:ABC transporter substrate-binding protein n=1 Tax=Streptomyces sp. S3(2020) TaxID=2732044 RepID=UPI001488B943|nr:extracellular solute-binding protein [Streptomyces sp. S3(2020)]NNN33079.1 extracellular solute-binding protein [Streptomyces sp. S3(2020)]